MTDHVKSYYQTSVELAHHRGAKIEYRKHGDMDWTEISYPSFHWRTSDYRVKAEPVGSTAKPDEIPWSAINPRFTHSAREPNGMIFVYEGKPEVVGGGFSKSLPHLRIDHILNCRAGSVAWAGSKQKRKETVWLTAASAEEGLKVDPVAPIKPLILDRGHLRRILAMPGAAPSKAPEVATELARLNAEMSEVKLNIDSIRAAFMAQGRD